MKPVVPDTIEPYHGIKALVIHNETLVSPQRKTVWPPRQRLEASCPIRSTEWKLRQAPTGWEEKFWVPASVLRQNETTDVGWPSSDPPDGMTWVAHEQQHQLERCRCGIHVTNTPQQCEHYLRRSTHPRSTDPRGNHAILALVALWGQVVRAEHGARGQYAYPQLLVGPWQWETQLKQVADNYRIGYHAVEVAETSDQQFKQLLLRNQ